MKVELKYAVTRGERTIISLDIPDKPKVRHLLAGDAYEKGTVAFELAVLESMTGESATLLQEMDYEDWVHIEAVLGSRFKNYSGESENPTKAAE